jgi:outer membrane murein-binding lipoprotein Lpp
MVSVDFHKRRNVVKKIIISALVVAGLTFTGAASAKKIKISNEFKGW